MTPFDRLAAAAALASIRSSVFRERGRVMDASAWKFSAESLRVASEAVGSGKGINVEAAFADELALAAAILGGDE